MQSFDPNSYGPALADLVVRPKPCDLGPGRANTSVKPKLDELTDSLIFSGQRVIDRDMARCCHAALWLLHDYLDESHTISQEVGSTTGSYWHGIMHRREPDFGNSKYWFRRVGKHPAFEPLHGSARSIVNAKADGVGDPDREVADLVTSHDWDPFLFVDLCHKALNTHSNLERVCREIAQAEWQVLFHYCYRSAIGTKT
jgi:hypothetical protein